MTIQEEVKDIAQAEPVEAIALEEPINETCPAVGYQAVSVCVPVSITPFAKSGATVTKCCGEPVIRSGMDTCKGEKNGTCNFTISQNIVVSIPVEFGAEAKVGETYVNCIEASSTEIDCKVLIEQTQEASATK